jgi:PTS system nitrogen regulatory IIA component
MKIVDLLALDRIRLQTTTSSKKRALEILSQMLATTLPTVSEIEIFDALINRERLGSTGLGHGVAIPHSRLDGAETAVGAILKLEEGIDYDSPDHQPVDFMFALLVPQDSTDEHLALLSQLAEMFADEEHYTQLRTAQQANTLLNLLSQHTSSHAA